jgi:hypothetical protein
MCCCLCSRLLCSNSALSPTNKPPDVDLTQIIYLLRELWRGFSARSDRVVLPGGDRGLMRSTADLTLLRWDARRPATVDNLVLLTLDEADAHEADSLERLRREEPGFVAFVERQLGRARFEYCGERGEAAGVAERVAAAAKRREQQRQQG